MHGSELPDGVTYLGLNSQLVARLFRVYGSVASQYGELIESAFQFCNANGQGYISFLADGSIVLYAENADTGVFGKIVIGD
jgi:hypothetical protein